MFDWLKYILGGNTKESERSGLYRQWVDRGELPSNAVPKRTGSPVVVEKPLGKREAHIRSLESVAEVEEAKNKELEGHLEFKKKEEEVLVRVREAHTRKRRLGELLGEYGTPRSFWSVKLLVTLGVGVGFVLLLTLIGSC